MKIPPLRFNIYLLVLLAALAIGCRTAQERKEHKQASTLRIFVESGRDASHASGVTVYRNNPIHISVDREPVLSEADLESAAVVDVPGGYAISAQFNGHGALILEGVTVAHKSQHLAIQSNFGETRWLAAPVITRRISNGELVFTPDATLDESYRIVRGLTNLVAKIKKDSSF
jgi:hypothetical protein